MKCLRISHLEEYDLYCSQVWFLTFIPYILFDPQPPPGDYTNYTPGRNINGEREFLRVNRLYSGPEVKRSNCRIGNQHVFTVLCAFPSSVHILH